MATDKLKLYNGALRIVGERRLADLDEKREPRFLLDDVWEDDAIRYALEQGQWQFATRTVKLEIETSIEPEFGFKYAYKKPDDYVRTVAISFNEHFTDSATQFADEVDYWFADLDVLYVKYVSDDASFGRNYALWPESYTRYVMSYMGFEIAPKLLRSQNQVDNVERKMKKYLSDAQSKDGVNRPTRFPPSFDFRGL